MMECGNSYKDLKNYIAGGSSKTVRKIDNNTVARMSGDDIVIMFQYTDICIVYPNNSRRLYTGGWYTHTTKDRFNKLLPWPFSVFQKAGTWYIRNHITKEQWNFTDGVLVTSDIVLERGK